MQVRFTWLAIQFSHICEATYWSWKLPGRLEIPYLQLQPSCNGPSKYFPKPSYGRSFQCNYETLVSCQVGDGVQLHLSFESVEVILWIYFSFVIGDHWHLKPSGKAILRTSCEKGEVSIARSRSFCLAMKYCNIACMFPKLATGLATLFRATVDAWKAFLRSFSCSLRSGSIPFSWLPS